MSSAQTARHEELFDKLCLFFCGFSLCQMVFRHHHTVLTFLLAFIVISLLSYFTKKVLRDVLLGIYALLCLLLPPLTLYLPALVFEIAENKLSTQYLILSLPVLFLPFTAGWTPLLLLIPFLTVSVRLKIQTVRLQHQQEKQNLLKDQLEKNRSSLSRLKQTQKEQQENEVRLATLNERTRIARDIHDNVGHLLSSALLQTAALSSGTNDETGKAGLSQLKETLNEALDRIRSSVHQLHDTPVDLEAEISRLLGSLTGCRCEQTVELAGIPGLKIRRCLLAIIREALNNVIRHSNADRLDLNLKEHPVFYQLIIRDNGSVESLEKHKGMGLSSIRERVSQLGGQLHIDAGNGFSLFVTLPKEKSQ